ncbi:MULTISPECIES: putative zinc-binding metallopeptidase [unclassified Roseateles]|uniref:zinc-binding metallopeptidase family protein n=1 Tax=unclassified Roseateles TaxID=2626991 RepID=UPI0006FA15FC|nr:MULTISPECIES: putative zinc-binding metallopeptidase [unclassified Roseateles]KQW52010.1 DNA polymerase III subunit gamma/tau [Pelomonas sp. Root405]KRA78244.1 DNA polymerase III subunit gamma/tau [Pelomonas sp. Root662]
MVPVAAIPHAVPPPMLARAYSCACGRPVFFRNSECLACHRPLGYDALRGRMVALDAAPSRGRKPGWREAGVPVRRALRYARCANLDTAAACNWLLDAGEIAAGQTLCRCCRLTRTLPDLSLPNAGAWWRRVEQAKRRLVSSLIGLKLPVISKAEDPERGLVFDLLLAAPGAPPVMTGHADGVITLDVSEADDSCREQRRDQLGEPYRTLLGHLRHESGHYYWQRLVEPTAWLEPCRELFGDEREDYGAALQRHYANGAPADWGQRFVSAYASAHPWEDWAETWAHYLHLVDTLDTARSFGLDGERVELSYERFDAELLRDAGDADATGFLQLINSWMELTGVLNELSRSMGMADFYPFVLSAPAVRKLHLVHRIVRSASA